MVGQDYLKQVIQQYVDKNLFPRFVIITGQKGSGKKTLAKYIAKRLSAYEVYPGNSVEDVRQAIENAYHCTFPAIYIFPDSDRMSAQAKNALLKVTEEPPRNAYFIITVEDIGNTLSTLKSRGTELKMEAYSEKELSQFTLDETVLKIATNPGQVEQLLSMNAPEFYKFCIKVIDNIGEVTGVNALKIGQSFSFKEDQEGYDPVLFLDCVSRICFARCVEEYEQLSTDDLRYYNKMVMLCGRYKNELNLTGVKKDATFDAWLLECWKLGRE